MATRPPDQQATSELVTRSLTEAIGHHQAGRLADAERLYGAVLELEPLHGESSRLLGALYVQSGKPEQALPMLQQALQTQPQNPQIFNHLGIALGSVGRGNEAIAHFQRALAITPGYPEALNNLGNALLQQGNTDAALDYCKQAIQLRPAFAEAHTTMAAALLDMGRVGDALECQNRALTYAPDFPNALWGKGISLLAQGEYREGWKLYDARFGDPRMRGSNLFASDKSWDGKPQPAKHLLIWTEQGLGDSLQFIRYVELCKKRFHKVSVFCSDQSPLVRLFKALSCIDDAFDTMRDGFRFDEHIPMMSLPRAFGTVLETVPAAVPYLQVDPALQAKWTSKFTGGVALKVGLVWAGGARLAADKRRSIGLESMKPWLGLPGTRFYNLQMGEPREQIAAFGLGDRLIDFMDDIDDFADTAALVQNLDLVITVDTSVAHLAGGLGKPVWILSRYDADWRWLQNRRINPWYPTARIFGQPSMGDWDSVVADVERELKMALAKNIV